MTGAIIKFPAPAFQVHTSIARVVSVGGQDMRAYCEDWPTVELCERAMTAVIEFCRSTSAPDWDSLADTIMLKLGVPADTVHGCSIIVEPLDVLARDGLPQDLGAGEV